MREPNKIRAARITRALAEYIEEDPNADKDQFLGDLLSDIRHYCDLHKLDFAECDRMGRMHYVDEIAQDIPVYDVAKPKPVTQHSNAGKPWSADEDRQLLALFDAGKSLKEINDAHGRTLGGIRARLEKHGRLEPSAATRWPTQAKK